MPKICPIMTAGAAASDVREPLVYCKSIKCAWWNLSECVVLSIGAMLSAGVITIKETNSAKEEGVGPTTVATAAGHGD
ncbi:hypothetical protein [Pelotomaculum propionicicum]|uniref:Uncharacterized protein n=1 Tax=Pelotomaculum propionicicum TaxID=258475 RepID=A0A4Y7RX40_9FIRM|nr:hypothetical protein [Pelotomaculum propionicicum]TEB13413.1 hypothetical protein Pmgp_00307 [Pelotomaculum propionicicum]